MSNGNGQRPDQDFMSFLLPALIGLLVIAAVAYYFLKVREKGPEGQVATHVATAPATAPVEKPAA
jgi:hypothetical protein